MVKTIIRHFDRAHNYGKNALARELSMIRVPWEILITEIRSDVHRYHVEFRMTDEMTTLELDETLEEIASASLRQPGRIEQRGNTQPSVKIE